MDYKEMLETLKGHFNETMSEVKTLVQNQDAELKRQGEVTAETAGNLTKATERLDELKVELDEVQKRYDELDARQKRIMGGSDPDSMKSPGELFIESDAYKAYKDANFNGHTAPVPFDRKLLDSTPLGTPDAFGFPANRQVGFVTPPDRTDRVRSLFPTIPTSSPAIEYVRETGFTNAAAPVAEGAAKPESDITFDIVQDTAKTIAHYIKATRQIISDWAALQGYINSRLLTGIDLTEDTQLLYGDGLGANMRGLLTDPNRQTYAWSAGSTTPVADTKIDALRRAMTLSRLAEYPVSGVVVHPDDWEDIELAKGSDGHYIWTTVMAGGQQRVWRAPVVDTTAIQSGQAVVGAFQLGAAVWDREQSTIRVADQHASDFTSNLFTILAEERLALSIYRPEAFVHVTFDSAPV